MTDPADVVVAADSLRDFYAAAFQAVGVPREHSLSCAAGLHYADLHGISTHGAGSLNRLYLRMVREGQVDVAAVPEVEREHQATTVINGNNGLGFIAAERAMLAAIERSRRFGVGVAVVRNSSHCGCMGWYTGLAVRAGAIGIASTNCGTQGILPPPGGRQRLLGTNVLAAAAPAGDLAPFSLDMSAAVVAAGRVRLARDRGERIPAGWLADEHGQPVTDPAAYFAGTAQLRFLGGAPDTGGYKGYGLAILADVLCGALTGAAMGPGAPGGGAADGRDDADIGHFFLAIDVSAFRDRAGYAEQMDRMLSALCDCAPVDPDHAVSYPGRPEHLYRESLHDRVTLAPPIAAELDAVARELGVPAPYRLAGNDIRAGAVTAGE